MLAAARALAMFVAAAVAGLAHAQGDPKVLRIMPHSNLTILDPIWTTAYIARNHGYMIYDTLFGRTRRAQSSRRWWTNWTVSKDKDLDFHAARRLEFHDGKPVTGEDVVASLQRWGKRDAWGRS